MVVPEVSESVSRVPVEVLGGSMLNLRESGTTWGCS